MPDTTRVVELLQVEADESEEQESHYRFLVDGTHIKYVTIAGGLYPPEDLTFAPILLPLLPAFPVGDWNEGYIARNTASGAPYFSSTTKTQLPTVTSAWHSTRIEQLDLTFGEKLRTGVYEVKSSKLQTPAVAKFARFSWEIGYLDGECRAYQWIDGHDIGPKFFGQLTEEGRCIGIIIENIDNARHATPEDLSLCQQALSKLHGLGILHGDVNKHNFLIKDDRAVLIDFDTARKCEDEAALEEEMARLPIELADTSGKGGSIIEDE